MLNLLGEGLSVSNYIYIALLIIIGLIFLVFSIIKVFVQNADRRYRWKKVELEMKPIDLVRANLDRAGFTDIEVVESAFRNKYRHKAKKLYISRRNSRRANIASISKAMQLVSIAIIRNTDENANKRAILAGGLNIGATTLFYIMFFVSLGLNFLTTGTGQVLSIVLFSVAIIFYIISAVYSIGKANLTKRASKQALEIIENMGVFNEKEVTQIKRLYKLSYVEYVIDSVIAAMFVLYYTFRVLGKTLFKKHVK